MTTVTIAQEAVFSSATRAHNVSHQAVRIVPDDLCNLLQVAASVLHLIERQIDDDLRPLLRVGLGAIRQAGRNVHPILPASSFNSVTGELHGQIGK